MSIIAPSHKAFDPDMWWGRAIRVSRGNATPFGSMLLAILGSKRARWGDHAIIKPDKTIWATLDGEPVARHLCTVDEFRTFLYDLASACDMSTAEQTELYDKARSYIHADLTPGGTDILATPKEHLQ